jgi:hypothetical protein
MREIRTIQRYGETLRQFPGNRAIQTKFLPEAEYRIGADYSYTVQIRGRDSDGNLVETYRQVTTNRANMTPDEVIAEALEFKYPGVAGYPIDDLTAAISTGRQQLVPVIT